MAWRLQASKPEKTAFTAAVRWYAWEIIIQLKQCVKRGRQIRRLTVQPNVAFLCKYNPDFEKLLLTFWENVNPLAK